MTFRSTKTYGHDIGLSAVFRQHRARSHCRFLHGYALAVRLEFECEDGARDENGWVVDFGGMKDIKRYLQETFDHKVLVAHDDPQKDEIMQLAGLGLADVVEVAGTGCEAFAAMIYIEVDQWLRRKYDPRHTRLAEVHVMEHGANSAVYIASK